MVRSIRVGADAVSSGNFEPIPVGTKLRMAVYEISEGVTGPNSKRPGTPQFVFTAKVTEEGQYKGRELKYNYVTLDPTADNAWALAAFAEAVGWPVTKIEGSDDWSVEVPDNLSDVLGTEFIGRVGQTNSQKINEATGKPYVNNNVRGYAPLKAGAPAPKPTEQQTWDSV